MRVNLNETPFYKLAHEAVDAVDKVLAGEATIGGLKVNTEASVPGFTFIDEAGNYTSGLRAKKAEDSGYDYSLLYATNDVLGLQRADFTREGYLIYLTYQSEPLDEIPALGVVTSLVAEAQD